MLSSDKIEECKKLNEEANEIQRKKAEIITEGKLKKQQALDKLKEYGLTSFSDISKLEDELSKKEKAIEEQAEEARLELANFAKYEQERDSMIVE